jgi:hypothetical protein
MDLIRTPPCGELLTR